MSETLYRKEGRRYVPVYNATSAYDKDLMKTGTWRMVYAYNDGGRRFEYDVKPDTASFVAACMLARHAMEQAIEESVTAKPMAGGKFTAKQQKIIEQCEEMMRQAGILTPMWWQHGSAYEISQAAIHAVMKVAE
jgi:hypothetical protein